MRNRSRFEILYTILKLCSRGKRTTHLLRSANLSYNQLTRYVSILTEKGLLDFDGREYTTTREGVLFIKQFEEMLALTTEEIPPSSASNAQKHPQNKRETKSVKSQW